jgi:hypothetical protein
LRDAVTDFEEHFPDGWRIPPRSGAKLVIAFAGGPQNVYQFGASLRALRVPHVLMRDSTQKYHGFGVEGIGDRAAVIDYIRSLVHYGWRVVTTGVSSGAYAALLYGQLVPVDEVVAISPLSGRELDDFDPKWHAQIYDPNQHDMDDLRKYFRPGGPVPKVRAFISDDDPTCTLDRQMCTRIGIRGRDITLIPGYTHGDLARLGMRDKGMFQELFG